MESLRVRAMEMPTNQLEALLRHEQMDFMAIQMEIENLQNKILGLKYNESVKHSSIEALEDILTFKTQQERLKVVDELPEDHPFNPFKEQ
ncbi:hypothetical protein [Burkholderia vietnamiensis]|uniref:hypothetical protein n=1 Tax=Burkholderia vietnamiensis TaxID=60552 RepID=UPI001593021B|nr:hypothetical protein [Burkholderia vietnamiensis]